MGALKSSKCSRGHRLVEPNLYWRKNGQRECKACKGERNKVQEAKRKDLAKAAGVAKKGPRKGRGKAATLSVRQRILAREGKI